MINRLFVEGSLNNTALLAFLVLNLVLVHSASTTSSGFTIQVSSDPDGQPVSEGVLIIDAAAEDIITEGLKMKNLESIFTDIEWIDENIEDWKNGRVRLTSKKLGHPHSFTFNLDRENRKVRFEMSDPHYGVKLFGMASMESIGEENKRTKIRIRLYYDETGFWGMFIPKSIFRKGREEWLNQLLNDLAVQFTPRTPQLTAEGFSVASS